MSWVFGFSGILSEQKKLGLSSLFPTPSIKYDSPRLFMVAGGNEFTCMFSKEKQWLVLGVGIETNNYVSKMLTKEDWEKKINGNSYNQLDGHFIIINWNDEKVIFKSDRIGLRTIYFYKDKAGVYFSSNLNWLTTIMNSVKINFIEFGSRWLTFNQLSNNSFIDNIEQLKPGSGAEIKSTSVSFQNENWLPEIKPSSKEHLINLLDGFMNIDLPDNLKMSFGLSGGLDSRFLLSILLKNKYPKFNIHSYGFNDDEDLQIAKQISEKLALKCHFLQPTEIGSGRLMQMASEYIASTSLIESISSFLKLTVFNNNYFKDKFLMDGALAEFARRQFLNRLLIKGKGALVKKNYREVIKYLLVDKPDIFKVEYSEMMLENSIEQLRIIFENFPDPSETGPENFVDLLVSKFRVPNYFGPEQVRIDNILPGIMPFAQASVIESSLGIPVKERKNSNLFYKTINSIYPALEDFPLVKNSVIYPYGLSSVSSFAYTKIKKSLKKTSGNLYSFDFFKIHEKMIRDILTREEIREYKAYNEESVIRVVNDFYGGKYDKLNELDWLLTFELFRKNLNITSN
jgi:hypothetical protein